MKKQFIILIAIFLTILLPPQAKAQSPEKMNYQAVARDNAGNILNNQLISFRISILQGSSTGTSVYSETHQATTNDFGLANLNIGDGSIVSGDFTSIDWSSYLHFLKVEMDPAGGSAFQLMGTSQLLSVPYALHAKTADNISGTNSNLWSTTGNAGTDPATNFIGTTDDQPIIFKVGNVQAGKISSEFHNSFYGIEAGVSNTTGHSNTANGIGALYSNTDRSNLVAIGDSALYHNGLGATVSYEATDNTAIGSKSLYSNTTGPNNTAIGGESLKMNTIGYGNSAIGFKALFSNEVGSENTASGRSALMTNMSGWYNTATGTSTLEKNISGSFNTATGHGALWDNTTGIDNTACGAWALKNNTTGSHNTAIGRWTMILNKTGYSNTAIGIRALFKNTDRSNLVAVGDSALYNNGVGATATYQAIANTAVGSKSLYSNTTGSSNTANGYSALFINNTGFHNTATGAFALYSNTSGSYNTASGYLALFNSTGDYNTASGRGALYSNTSGHSNTANGYNALFSNGTGYENTAAGYQALYNTTTAGRNVGVGYQAGFNNSTGFYNTAVGYKSGPATDNIKNSTAIGRGASTTAWNQIRIGNNIVTSIGGYTTWSNISDKRFKKAIQNDIVGLDFIMALEPVSYQLDMDKLEESTGNSRHDSDSSYKESEEEQEFYLQSKLEKGSIRQSGFLAQDVELAAESVGYDFSGVDKPKNEDDFYGLRYAEFVVPLVKALQEQQEIIEQQNINYEKLLKRVEELEKQ